MAAAPMALSCGVLIFNDHGSLFLAHVTGQAHWDLPKGLADHGEAPIDAAVRETQEETGLVLSKAHLVDLGRMSYLPRKDLHLFAACLRTDEVDLSRCICSSTFVDRRSGAVLPEANGFAWFPKSQILAHTAPSMGKLLITKGTFDQALQSVGCDASPQIRPPPYMR